MTTFDRKINQIAARHGWRIAPAEGWKVPTYTITPMDRQERDQIVAVLKRCKTLSFDVRQVFSPYAWACSIWVHDRAEWEALQEYDRKEREIINAFSKAYHFNGHDSDGAKAAAREKAVEIGALDVFNKFYHVA